MKGRWASLGNLTCVECERAILPGSQFVVEDGTSNWEHYPECEVYLMTNRQKVAIFFLLMGSFMFLSSAFLANLWLGLFGMATAFTAAFHLEKTING